MPPRRLPKPRSPGPQLRRTRAHGWRASGRHRPPCGRASPAAERARCLHGVARLTLKPPVTRLPPLAVWTGVRLRDVLKAAGLQDDDPNVNHIQVGRVCLFRTFSRTFWEEVLAPSCRGARRGPGWVWGVQPGRRLHAPPPPRAAPARLRPRSCYPRPPLPGCLKHAPHHNCCSLRATTWTWRTRAMAPA